MRTLSTIIRWGLHAIRPQRPLVAASNALRVGTLLLVLGLACELVFFVSGRLGIAEPHPLVRASGNCIDAKVFEVCPAITIADATLAEISKVFAIPEKRLLYFNARRIRDQLPAGSVVVLPLPKGWTR
jgi:hypothetical protein